MAVQTANRITNLPDPIAFTDLASLENSERDRLQGRLLQLTSAQHKRPLTTNEKSERDEIEQKLRLDDIVDPLFKAVQKGLDLDVEDHKAGLFPSQQTAEALQALWSGLKSGRVPIGQLQWAKIVELAGLGPFDADGSLAESLPGLINGIDETHAMLTSVGTLFKTFVSGPNKLADDVVAACAANNRLKKFGGRLAEAIKQSLIKASESLIDWLAALLQGERIPNEDEVGKLTADEKMLAAVAGLLELDKAIPPGFHLPGFGNGSDPVLLRREQDFVKAAFTARGEYQVNIDLFEAVLPYLVAAGAQGPIDTLSAAEWAGVARYLIKRGVTAGVGQLGRRVNEALNSIQNVGDDVPPSDIGIDLPDLEEETNDFEIVADNIFALQPAYFAAMFEELKAFQVLDKLVELFQNGVLPLGRGEAGNGLFRYWKETAQRVSEGERRSFYSRTLGVPGGDDGGMPNREFNDLWMRFVSAVSSFIRQNSVDDLLRSRIPGAISQQMVRKTGRDLATNLSLHGYGMAYFMATELQKQVKDVIKLLSDPDIRNAYGARDMWQVIDQVATLELGGPRNSVRYRTMAASGAIIIAWLADRSRKLSNTSFEPILDVTQIQNPAPRMPGTKPTTKPTDYDLVNACDQWLAVTGTQEEQVEDYAQPKEAPNMTSRPVQIPAIARDLLDSVGVPSLGLSAAAAGGNGYTRR